MASGLFGGRHLDFGAAIEEENSTVGPRVAQTRLFNARGVITATAGTGKN